MRGLPHTLGEIQFPLASLLQMNEMEAKRGSSLQILIQESASEQ